MSPRWVLMHVNQLPLRSAFVAETRGGPEFIGWDESQYMTANLINSIKALTYTFVLANIAPKTKTPKPPTPYPVPDKRTRSTVAADKPGSFAAIAKARLAEVKKKKEGGG